ncbi:MAG: hypothetical protein A4E53_00379 [Pelotomaculum sp. PtaB.Bin104]|nr:MAG: hypothetical protein A4E53_00379 [Pelotomaculum sp. PtaB.Bin104]
MDIMSISLFTEEHKIAMVHTAMNTAEVLGEAETPKPYQIGSVTK